MRVEGEADVVGVQHLEHAFLVRVRVRVGVGVRVRVRVGVRVWVMG